MPGGVEMGMYSTRTDTLSFQDRLEAERPRIVRLCTYWLGDGTNAEDAAQEVFIEAWRHIGDLRDAHAFRGWLSGIARNVCARWGRTRQRKLRRIVDIAIDTETIESGDRAEDTVTVELERDELATLLDRALALLPEDARAILVQKYLEEAPNEEIATYLGLNPNATAVRLHRGKMALRTVLATHFAEESATMGLVTANNTWQKTSIWCPSCGDKRLVGKWDSHEFILRCPTCHEEPNTFHAQTRSNLLFQGLKGFRPALTRFTTSMNDFFMSAILTRTARCQRCQRPTPLRKGFPHYAPASVHAYRGLHVYCDYCGAGSYETLDDLALGLPEGRAFFRTHPHIHVLPQREIEYEGTPALVVGYASHVESATFHVIVNGDTYEVLSVPGISHE
jgi:RNA polymerase sigma factor (sigma-70 family)